MHSPEETWKLDPNTIYVSGFNQEGAESITKEDFKNAFAEVRTSFLITTSYPIAW